MGEQLDGKIAALEQRLGELGSTLVCYSGGVDSAFLLAMATRVLGERAVGMTAVSPSLAERERDAATLLAQRIGAVHRLVESREIEDANYVKNAPDRCFHCKSELYRIATEKQAEWQLDSVLNGTNIDDLGDYRPGLEAAKEAGVISPFVDLNFSKQDVRDAAKRIGLEVWDKPAAACLSSRIPYGTSVTRERLAQVGGFEAALADLGFRQLRVRYHDEVARIELGADELAQAAEPSMRDAIVKAGKVNGFRYITLDLGGYRQGSHNEVLVGRSLKLVD
jgi:uncharacterized protein